MKELSLEILEQISREEAGNQAKKASAQAEAKRLVQEAEQAGQALMRQTREQAAQAGAEAVARAEVQAGEETRQLQEAAAREAERLRSVARSHMDAVAEWIVGKVVNG